MEYQGLTINHLEHSGFCLEAEGLVVYLDPYNLTLSQVKPAAFVLISHNHFDHLDPNGIKKVAHSATVIIGPTECQKQLAGLKVKEIIYVSPGQKLELDGLKLEVMAAYNLNKFKSAGVVYHPKEDEKVGYVVELAGVRIYHAGDTDKIPEMEKLERIDITLLPVSGTYVMDFKEAAETASLIKPKLVIPMHYGSVIGSLSDAEKFKELATGCAVAII